ncbi:hypothetical protein Vretifemale_16802 [Volvox reticuliferus]|uniref:Retrotransposon gag domain-containing protein n=1 Tax=Volvox reticuliferus TaxID=1737510 RepID=A0A8J4FVU6_9CHLO|nr:hypothetical protein Vretifemale_16802 [Volvox reticuliferus]
MASLFALAGGRNRVNTYSGLPNPRPIAVAMASGSQARQAVPAVGALPDAVDQHTGRLDAVANSGNETTLNRIPSMGVANEPVNVLAAAPPVPATQTPSRRTLDGQPILPIAEQSPSTTHPAAELPRVSLPTPALMLDDKLDAKKASARVRAFIRDVNLFFGIIPWGRDQRSCCLFLSQALRGNAKVWYDEWSLSQTQLTVESILENLRIRFAPQILSVEQEARQKLADKSFYMRTGENVPAYHARLEALFQDIPDIHPREKLFWFQQGLSGVLQPKCAADERGRPFTSYDDLVRHASGEEARILAERRFRSGVRSNAIAMQDVDGDDAMEASDGEPPAKRVRARAPQAATAAVGAGPSSASRPRQRGKRPSSGGRGNARGDRRGHHQGRGGGGVNPQSLTADQERELTSTITVPSRYHCSS